MFILLMSGVILSPMGVYAMIEEEAPQTPSIPRPTPAGPSASGLTQEEKNSIIEHADRAAARRGFAMMPPSWVDWQSGTPEGVQRMKERAALIQQYGDRINFDAQGNPSTIVPSFMVPPIR